MQTQPVDAAASVLLLRCISASERDSIAVWTASARDRCTQEASINTLIISWRQMSWRGRAFHWRRYSVVALFSYFVVMRGDFNALKLAAAAIVNAQTLHGACLLKATPSWFDFRVFGLRVWVSFVLPLRRFYAFNRNVTPSDRVTRRVALTTWFESNSSSARRHDTTTSSVATLSRSLVFELTHVFVANNARVCCAVASSVGPTWSYVAMLLLQLHWVPRMLSRGETES